VSLQTRSARAPSGEGALNGVVRVDDRLSFMDQACLQLLRATGRGQLMQAVWIYEHPVDVDGLRRFHRNFGYGMAGRLIERSPLPFGRHRWVSALGPSSDIDFADRLRPRAEVIEWADERAALPVDPESGPGWHLGVVPLTDGSTAVSLVLSHYLTDGVGFLLTVADAVNGNRRDLGHPMPRSRSRFRGAVSDLRQTAQAAPEVTRTLVAAAKLAFRHRRDMARSGAPRPAAVPADDGDSAVVLPSTAIYVDVETWDARANALGGTSYSLLAGFAAKLGERIGRRRADDGAVNLVIALNGRDGLDDTRANAISFARVSLDPTNVATDMTQARLAIRQALKASREVPDETLQLLPLVPLVPRRALKRVADLFFGSADEPPVSCSNLGDLDPAVGRPDGTEAEYLVLRGVDQNISRRDLERAGGQLVLVAARIGGKISIGIVAYQVGAENSRSRLRELAAHTLADFDLCGVIH
jgi:hypothetical protein